MELSILDWMIVIGVLLALAVLLDALRRMSRDRKNQVRLSRNAKRALGQNEDGSSVDFPSELPNGGARVVGIMEGPDIDPTNPPDIPSERIPVKIKQDPRVLEILNKPEGRQEPTFVDEPLAAPQQQDQDRDDPLFMPSRSKNARKGRKGQDEGKAAATHLQPSLFDEDRPQQDKEQPEEIIVLNVLAKNTKAFSGEDLLHILLACDCRFGEMNIFHRYEGENATGEIQFSIVNIVEPGVFNLKDIQAFSTPGVSFFLRLPGPQDPLEAFKCMVETAQCLVRNLDGELKDERRSTATQQTLEHTRERIRDFLKRQLVNGQ